jgi:hypothetical protein
MLDCLFGDLSSDADFTGQFLSFVFINEGQRTLFGIPSPVGGNVLSTATHRGNDKAHVAQRKS